MVDETTTLEVRLNARLPSVQRGDRYEDPLAYWLEDRFPGSRVTGGGTLRSREGEPLVCGIDAEVVGDPDEIEDDDELLGIYRGVPLPERSFSEVAALPDQIAIFRGPILRIVDSREEAVREVRETVIHEIGHYFGLDDDEMPF